MNERLQKIIIDLKKIQNKLAKLIIEEQRKVDFLGRSADSVWEYPNPDEKYEKYLELLSKAENGLYILESVKDEKLADIIKTLESI